MPRFLEISQEERRQGLYVIGTSGTGKSTFLANMILADIEKGFGVCLIEPAGDLTNSVIGGIPAERLDDVILLDLANSDNPFGLNLFQCNELRNIQEVTKTADFVLHVFEKIWGAGTDTPRLMQVLRVVTRTLIENPGTTFAEIPLLLSNESVWEKMIKNLTNEAIASFWRDYNLWKPYNRHEYIESTLNKVNAFLDDPMVRNIVGQAKTTVDFRSIMDNGKILLVKLSPQFKTASLLVGSIIIGKLLLTAWSRENIRSEKERRQFNLYCDEYQRFATSDFADFIEGARKFGIAITLSHQSLTQLDEKNKAAATQAANLIVFRVTGEDAKALAKNFDTTPTQEIIGQEPIRAPVSDVINHLVRRGHTDARVAQFGQTYLKNFVNCTINNINSGIAHSQYSIYGGYQPSGLICLQEHDLEKARIQLNQTLYRCMVEKSSFFIIPPLALFMLAATQMDGSDCPFLPFIDCGWFEPHYFQGFKKVGKATAEIFGDPGFLNEEYGYDRKFIETRDKK